EGERCPADRVAARKTQAGSREQGGGLPSPLTLQTHLHGSVLQQACARPAEEDSARERRGQRRRQVDPCLGGGGKALQRGPPELEGNPDAGGRGQGDERGWRQEPERGQEPDRPPEAHRLFSPRFSAMSLSISRSASRS